MENYDIVIVSHEKDFNNIKFIIEHSEKNLKFDSIHLILSERGGHEFNERDLKTLTTRPIYKHIETDVLKVDKSRLKYRPNWIYQMFLKMLQDVTKNDNFLIIESDCIILKDLKFFENGKTIFYLGREQNHNPYFEFNSKLLGIGREFNHTFISEFMMYDKKVVRHLIEKSNCKNTDEFLEKIYDLTNSSCHPADYELYGNFFYKYHNNNFSYQHLDFFWDGREKTDINPNWSDSEDSKYYRK